MSILRIVSMKKQIAIIQLKEKTTLLEQLRQTKTNLESQLKKLSEQVLLAELTEKENQTLRDENAALRTKLIAIKSIV